MRETMPVLVAAVAWVLVAGAEVEMAVLKARVMRVANTVVMGVVTVQAIKAGVMIMVAAAAGWWWLWWWWRILAEARLLPERSERKLHYSRLR